MQPLRKTYLISIADKFLRTGPVWDFHGGRGKSWRLKDFAEDYYIRSEPCEQWRFGLPLQFASPVEAITFRDECRRRLVRWGILEEMSNS